jgi:hypothetical protein
MPTFSYKGRKTSEIMTGTVEAETREEAIAQITAMAAPGEEIDVMQVQEGPTGGGATGTTGTTGASGAARGTRASRAQLNEMTKEELISEAEAEGVDVNHSWTKSDIVEAILHHK